MYFTWDGKMTSCARDYDAQLVVGDTASEGLMEIWNGRALADLRAVHSSPGLAAMEPCRSCVDTYRLARAAADEYIHALQARRPVFPPEEFARLLLDLLWALDAAMAAEDPDAVRRLVTDRFQALA